MGGPSGRRWNDVRSWEDTYGLALVLLLTVLVLPMLMESGRALTAASALVGLAACLVALYGSRVRAPVFWVAAGAAGLTVGGLLIDVRDPSPEARAVVSVGAGILLLLTPIAILVRIARHRIITPRTLYGALCVYLLIGLAFSFFYQALDHADDSAFEGLAHDDRSGYGYYSFVTLTTTGYGDIVPTSQESRSLAVFEVVIGQIFLVVIVARVVSMLGRERPASTHPITRRFHRDEEEAPHEDEEPPVGEEQPDEGHDQAR